MKHVQSPFTHLLDELFQPFGHSTYKASGVVPAVNIQEDKQGYTVAVIAPGFNKQDFTVQQENHLLTIKANAVTKATDEATKVLRQEFTARSFERSFSLNEKMDLNSIAASYENGILSVRIPKKEEVNAGVKAISIQ